MLLIALSDVLGLSDVSGLSEALENITVNLDSRTDLTVATISSGNITRRDTATFTALTITASSNLSYGSSNTNVATKISSIETNLNGKQSTLIAGR